MSETQITGTSHYEDNSGTRTPAQYRDTWQARLLMIWQQLAARSWPLVKTPEFAISAIIALSTILNFILVFEWSLYKSYLTSDMHGYWERAIQVFSGDEKTVNTWASNAPYYSRFIAEVFTWLNFLQLNHLRLEVLLSLNILLSALGTYSLYKIGNHIAGTPKVGLICAGLYAFSYPNLYFNTFLLGEPFAVPIIIFSIWLLFCFKDSYKYIGIVGLILAFAVGVRPSNGLLGLPFALYIVFSGFSFRKTHWKQWFPELFPRGVRAGIFSVVFFAVIFGIVAENYRVSDGRLAGITAHSGYNFFLGQTQAHKIESHFDGLHYGFVPSPVANHPEYGSISVTVPIYDSDTFYEMGWDVLKDNPHLWWDHLLEYDKLFFDNLFPAVPSVKGFNTLYDPFRYIMFGMLLLCGLLVIPLRNREISTANVAFFSSIFILLSTTLYFFTVTHQYFLNFSYTVYILFSVVLWSCIRNFRKHKRLIVGYCTFLVACTLMVQIYKVYARNVYEENIRVVAEVSRRNIFNFDMSKHIDSTDTFTVNNLEFFQSEGLLHGTLGDLEYKDNFYLTLETELEALEDNLYEFTFYVDDGYAVYIDGKHLVGLNGLKKMHEKPIKASTYLTKGRHNVRIEYFEARIFSGLMGYYKIPADMPPSRSEFKPKGGKGTLIGDDDKFTRFHLPETH